MTVQSLDVAVTTAAMVKTVVASYVPVALFFRKTRATGDLKDAPVRVQLPQTERPAKILVIDDDPVILKAVQLALTANRYEVITVTDGSAAVSSIHREKPDLILLDLLFPPDNTEGGMAWDGFHILEWLRHMEKAADTPVIVLTALESAECKEHCLAAGADEFLRKPLNMAELYAAVEKALDKTTRERRATPALNFEV